MNDRKAKQGLFRDGGQWKEGRQKERGIEYDESTLYTCIKME
jgi:hypothetical protein